jgi:malto-oligosyltrehalose trehalohydrolase
MPFGAELTADGAVRFRLWAPAQRRISVALGNETAEHPMQAQGDGWFEAVIQDGSARAGTLYRYKLEDGTYIPDPASRFQPRDAHGPSEVIDSTSYSWRNDDWRGRPWVEAVLYELHVGCFSDDGTFDGVRRHLDHLSELGITAIELMPLSDFEGVRNWGYDGVLPYAPDSAYGRPDSLKRLIDEAHGRQLMVFLDVVYNHFGPTGNYLNRYASKFFTSHHQTPWGDAVNFDDEGSRVVRDFFIHNALYWLEEYRFDGLRFDAVHAIKDDSADNILEEIARTVRSMLPQNRHVHLVLENDDNCAHLLERDDAGRAALYDAQWNDDFHHCAHVLVTGEDAGYYGDYHTHPIARFGRVLAEGFAYQGEASGHRGGRRRGEPSADLPPTAFVSFLQNHDQIGNRAFGERLTTLADPQALQAMQAILLLSPEIPMLFMGEEWGTHRPFLFFCDFHDELAEAVRDGRCREFSRFPQFQAVDVCDRIPDPNALDSFTRSRLDWSEAASRKGQTYLDRVRALLALRHAQIVPRLSDQGQARASYSTGEKGTVKVCWWLAGDARLHLFANLTATEATNLDWTIPGLPLHAVAGGDVELTADARLDVLPPWSVIVSLEDRRTAP